MVRDVETVIVQLIVGFISVPIITATGADYSRQCRIIQLSTLSK